MKKREIRNLHKAAQEKLNDLHIILPELAQELQEKLNTLRIKNGKRVSYLMDSEIFESIAEAGNDELLKLFA